MLYRALRVAISFVCVAPPCLVCSLQVVENDTGPNLGIAVCIAGELARLELDSKVANIIAPLAVSAKVGVFVSLETGSKAVYDNAFTNVSAACSNTPTVETVQHTFGAHYVNGTFSSHKIEKVKGYRFPLLYSDHDGMIASKTTVSRTEHISNVMGQLRHLKECSDLILAHENATGGRYRTVLKVRDNTLAVRQVSPEKILGTLHVHTKACSEWGGINDKTMVMHRRWLEKTLGAYYDTFASVMRMEVEPSDEHLRELMRAANTEQIQDRILKYMGVPVRRDSYSIWAGVDDILPFVDGRCMTRQDNTDHWCTVWPGKDCWPQREWVTGKTCHLLDPLPGQKAEVVWSADEQSGHVESAAR